MGRSRLGGRRALFARFVLARLNGFGSLLAVFAAGSTSCFLMVFALCLPPVAGFGAISAEAPATTPSSPLLLLLVLAPPLPPLLPLLPPPPLPLLVLAPAFEPAPADDSSTLG